MNPKNKLIHLACIWFFLASAALASAPLASASETGPIQAQAPALSLTELEVALPNTLAGIGSRIAPADAQGRFLYIITFNEPALARYDGGLAGLAATSTRATGQRRLDVNSAASRAYLDFLETQQAEHLEQMQRFLQRRLVPAHQWKNVLNGMTLRMTPEEAAIVQGLPFI